MNPTEYPTRRLNSPQPAAILAGDRRWTGDPKGSFTSTVQRERPAPGSTERDQPATSRRSRSGYIMAEAIIAFAIFGLALAGLFPFVLTQLRLTRKLEARFQGDVISYQDVARQYPVYPDHQNQAQTYYAVPWKNPRMRSLIGGASITTDQGNAIDDFTSQSLGNLTPTPVTIYSYQITYSDTTSDPAITVSLNVEAP
jgi:hypothetical protein